MPPIPRRSRNSRISINQLAERIDTMMRRTAFDMDEAARLHGDESMEFLWQKSKFEALESVLVMADPELAKQWRPACD